MTHATVIADDEAKIVDLQKQITQQKTLINSTKESTANVGSMHSIGDAGTVVASLQTQYLRRNEQDDPDLLTEVQTGLMDYFDQEAAIWFDADVTAADVGSWQCMTNYDFPEDTLNVVWICSDTTNTVVYAYATAIYNSTTGKFSGTQVRLTSAGQAIASATTIGGAENDN